MPTFTTWNDLLFPSGQDVTIRLRSINDGGLMFRFKDSLGSAKTSTLCFQEWNPNRLPSRLHLAQGLPSEMHRDLRRIIDEKCPASANRGHLPDDYLTDGVTPDYRWSNLQSACTSISLNVNSERFVAAIATYLSPMPQDIYRALTGETLLTELEVQTGDDLVITDQALITENDHKILILWENKSPKVFDKFITDLMNEIRGRENGIGPYHHHAPTRYSGYQAILGKLSHHATSTQPRIRWAVIFSGLAYIIIYIPRTSGRPVLHCSPVMTFSVRRGQEPDTQAPPLWSLLVYMSLTERFNVSDDILMQRLHIPVPSGYASTSGSTHDAERCKKSASEPHKTDEGEDECYRDVDVKDVPGGMLIQCMDAIPISLLPVCTPQSQGSKMPTFVHFDRRLWGSWASVYASTKSQLVVKFSRAAKTDHTELERYLVNEKAAYDKLAPLSWWVVPRCYGEYTWYGGRALVLSNEGPSLADLKMEFASLAPIERLVLFIQLYLVHRFGVYHHDFEPQNVLRKGWCRLFIIDFAFSDVNHACPGWRECPELKRVLRELLQLHKVWLIAGIICGAFIFFLLAFVILQTVVSFAALALIPVVILFPCASLNLTHP